MSANQQNDDGKMENRTPEQIAKDKYRFGGERYGFRGTAKYGPNDWIPQTSGLYAFPREDMQNPEPPEAIEDSEE